MKFNRKEMEEGMKVAESMKEHAKALAWYFSTIVGASEMLIVKKIMENPEISQADLIDDFANLFSIVNKAEQMTNCREFFDNMAEEIKRQIGEEGEKNA